jgi:hypothetical protein
MQHKPNTNLRASEIVNQCLSHPDIICINDAQQLDNASQVEQAEQVSLSDEDGQISLTTK